MIATALVGSMGIMLVEQINSAPLLRADDNEINQEVAVGMFEELGSC
jgi:hypothetical protein